jgi:cytochrome c biogenesis protein
MLKTFNTLISTLIKRLSNLQFAIFLLLLIAILSAFGTIIEQDKTASFYETNYPLSKPILGFITFKLIFFFGLDHIYQTLWFIILLLLFGISLLSCTITTQIPSLKLAKIWQFYKNRNILQKFELSFCIKNTNLSKLHFQLYSSNYNIIQQGPFLYAYKGLIGKLGPIIVHASIIIILFGSILGNLSGFTAQELIPVRQIFRLQNIINSGPFSYIDPSLGGYVKDFRITYSDEGNIDQFYSDLTIFNVNTRKNLNKTIYVNEPLNNNNLTFYQTDWNIFCIIGKIDNTYDIQLPLKLVSLSSASRFWITTLEGISFLNENQNNLFIVFEDLTGKYQIFNSKQNLLLESELGSPIFINGHSLQIKEVVPLTGLQIKCDPGIFIVYFGFILLILSTFLSYTSYSQIWAIKKDEIVYLSGRTNRAIYTFEKEFLEMLENTI